MFRLFSKAETVPHSKEELINELETMVFDINTQIRHLSSSLHRDKLLFSLYKFSVKDPYNLNSMKKFLTQEIEKYEESAVISGTTALSVPVILFLSYLSNLSEEIQAVRDISLIPLLSLEAYSFYSYFSFKSECQQLKKILALLEKNMKYNHRLSLLLDDNEDFAFRKHQIEFIREKNESLAIEERQNEYSTLHYTEWNPRESLIIPNRIGLLRG